MVWCDNCLLLFPLSAGAAVLSFFICLYSVAGGIFLFLRGQFFVADYDGIEVYCYGGVALLAAFIALIAVIAHSQSS